MNREQATGNWQQAAARDSGISGPESCQDQKSGKRKAKGEECSVQSAELRVESVKPKACKGLWDRCLSVPDRGMK